MKNNKINVLQLICSTGFYGAERWVLALLNNNNNSLINYHLAITVEHSSSTEIVEKFSEYKGNIHTLSMNYRFDLSVINKISALVKKYNIQIIHSHGYKSDILAWCVAKKMAIKCISTPHGFGINQSFKLKAYIALGFWFLKFHHRVLPLSKELLNVLLIKGIPENKLTYIANGVDLIEIDQSTSISSIEKNKEKQRIGYIGQLNERKNVQQLLSVFELLWQHNNSLELYLIGDGESENQLRLFASKLRCNNDVHFLGFQQHRLQFLSTFDLFLMTSISEGIPRCVMEAMAMKIPVAAFDIKGVDQLIIHNKTGVLAPLNDVEQLYLACESLLNNRDFSARLAENARQKILTEFSASRMALQYGQVFEQMINKN